MAEGAAVRIAVACEDHGHFRVTSALIDGACRTEHPWLDGVLDSVRAWQAEPGSERRYLKISADASRWPAPVVHLDGVPPIRLRGLIAGKPLLPDAAMWRSVLVTLVAQRPRPSAVVLVRDLDHDRNTNRRAGMEQVRDGIPWPPDVPIVLATPEPEIEAWIVSGFEPEDAAERALLAELRSALSFDPTTESHRLTSHPNTAPTDAKRVLAKLVDRDGEEREERCLADRDRLARRGADNHCRAFLDDVRRCLVPLFAQAE